MDCYNDENNFHQNKKLMEINNQKNIKIETERSGIPDSNVDKCYTLVQTGEPDSDPNQQSIVPHQRRQTIITATTTTTTIQMLKISNK